MNNTLTFREDLDDICHMPLAQFQRERQEIETRLTPQEFQAVLIARRLMNEDF